MHTTVPSNMITPLKTKSHLMTQPTSPSKDQPAWTQDKLTNPHQVEDKAKRVEAMFNAIADSYDLNNRVHSLWRDQSWRRAAVKLANVTADSDVLDVACGTGDLSMAFADAGVKSVTGVDFTYNMLAVAQHKRSQCKGVVPTYFQGDAMNLPIADNSVDVVSIAFGIRNVAIPEVAMAEFYRVLKPGGRLIVLEFSLPKNRLLLAGYNFYFRHIMPRTATWIARDKSGAYKYLPQSVNTFISRDQMREMFGKSGFADFSQKVLTCGIALVYRGIKA
jgi:demethylmenaquinone methyltransferase/2-methoxy-6-polyprenyl-1,4-benzoquinol methylase